MIRSEVLPIGAHWSPLELKILNEGLVGSIGFGGVNGVGGVCTEIFIHYNTPVCKQSYMAFLLFLPFRKSLLV